LSSAGYFERFETGGLDPVDSIGSQVDASLTWLEGLTEALVDHESDARLAEACLNQLAQQIPAHGYVAHRLIPQAPKPEFVAQEPGFHLLGQCPLSPANHLNMVEILEVRGLNQPLLVNDLVSRTRAWPYPEVRQAMLMAVPMGDCLWGYISVLNHLQGEAFDGPHAAWLAQVVQRLSAQLGRRETGRLQREASDGLLEALLRNLELAEPAVFWHSWRVARMGTVLARHLGCRDEELRWVHTGGLLHDIGKLGVCSQILNKREVLAAEELECLRQHPRLGYEMLRSFEQFGQSVSIVLYHHEQWDGGGYPLGLRGQQIPWLARIAAVADAYDAMTHDRPYRDRLDHRHVREILRGGAGRHWDADVVEAFLQIESQLIEIATLS